MKLLLLSLLTSATLFAQSFYVLTGVDSYDAVVVNMSPKTAKYSADIESLMQSMSKEIGVNIEGHPSRGLFFIISDISMGDTIGLRIELVLGEYVLRKGATQRVFDQLADAVEEMLETFKLQYQEDNKKLSKAKKSVSHETFATDMEYETNYQEALAKAKKEGKEIMLFMISSYCPWCRKLENRILSQVEIDAKIKAKYIPLVLNLDTDKFPKQFAKTRFTPILYVVNSKDENIAHQFTGYNNRDGFLHLLNK
jgi:thiol-disulfide isomerase/thioredoxin